MSEQYVYIIINKMENEDCINSVWTDLELAKIKLKQLAYELTENYWYDSRDEEYFNYYFTEKWNDDKTAFSIGMQDCKYLDNYCILKYKLNDNSSLSENTALAHYSLT